MVWGITKTMIILKSDVIYVSMAEWKRSDWWPKAMDQWEETDLFFNESNNRQRPELSLTFQVFKKIDRFHTGDFFPSVFGLIKQNPRSHKISAGFNNELLQLKNVEVVAVCIQENASTLAYNNNHQSLQKQALPCVWLGGLIFRNGWRCFVCIKHWKPIAFPVILTRSQKLFCLIHDLFCLMYLFSLYLYCLLSLKDIWVQVIWTIRSKL